MLLCGGTGKVMAQKNIDKMAAELEKRDDVAINSVTKRDSKTRKVVKVVKSFSLKDEKIGARLIEAFEKDESENSFEYGARKSANKMPRYSIKSTTSAVEAYLSLKICEPKSFLNKFFVSISSHSPSGQQVSTRYLQADCPKRALSYPSSKKP